jgi:glutamyl-tRNA synthetase
MGITHVIRGDDHISNTPKQIALYRALGAPLPVFAHVPMILGPDGRKLSKRHGATALGDYQHQGILPAAMRNFLALLGWAPGEDREILSEEELISLFSLEAIQKKPAVFDVAKLEWMNGQYLSRMAPAALVPEVERRLAADGVAAGGRDLVPLIAAVQSRARTLNQLAERVAVRLDRRRVSLEPKGRALIEKMGPGYAAGLRAAIEALSPLHGDGWTPERILAALTARAAAAGVTLGDALQPIRVALTGGTVSEPVNELVWVVGREESLNRLQGELERQSARRSASDGPVA